MLSYAFRRVLSAIPIALIAITVCFFILRAAPGGQLPHPDPAHRAAQPAEPGLGDAVLDRADIGGA